MRRNHAARTAQQSERVRVLEATVSRVAAAVAATPTVDEVSKACGIPCCDVWLLVGLLKHG